MAVDTAAPRPGLRLAGFRRVDHLETSIRSESELVPGSNRFRLHVPRSAFGHRYDSVVSWATIAVASGTAGAIITTIAGG